MIEKKTIDFDVLSTDLKRVNIIPIDIGIVSWFYVAIGLVSLVGQ